MSVWHELEDIKRKKADLEFQLRSMEEREKALEERVKILEEKLEIQELEHHLKAKHKAVEHLESKARDLQKRLKNPQGKPKASITKEPDSKSTKFRYMFKTR